MNARDLNAYRPRHKKRPAVLIPAWAVDRERAEPLYTQLVRYIRELIASGTLSAGAHLPSSRELASTLSVSRITVVTAYELLASEGLVESVAGSGTVVRGHAIVRSPSSAGLQSKNRFEQPSILRPRIGPLDALDVAIWRRVFSGMQRLRMVPSCAPDAGMARLRLNLAAYLSLTRRMQCTSDNIFVAATLQQAIGLLAATAQERGIGFHFEPHAPSRTRASFAAYSASCDLPESIAAMGAMEAVRHATGNGIFLAPSHSYPSGTTLSEHEREELALALDSRSVWAIEDYRDAEFLAPDNLSTVYGLRKGRNTIHLGTLSTVLAPYVRLAYVVAPADWVRYMAQKRFLLDDAASDSEEIAAELLETSMFHIAARAARQLATRRRMQLYNAASRYDFWQAPLSQHPQGLHALLRLEMPALQVDRLRGLIASLDPHYELIVEPMGTRRVRADLVLGFAATPDSAIPAQIQQVSAQIDSLFA